MSGVARCRWRITVVASRPEPTGGWRVISMNAPLADTTPAKLLPLRGAFVVSITVCNFTQSNCPGTRPAPLRGCLQEPEASGKTR